jgi:hypothetical protein
MSEAFWIAVSYWRQVGKRDGITEHLRSGRALDAADREWLALYIEGKIRKPRGQAPLAQLLDENHPEQLAVEAAAFEVSEATRAGEKRRGTRATAIEAAAAKWAALVGMDTQKFEDRLRVFLARGT